MKDGLWYPKRKGPALIRLGGRCEGVRETRGCESVKSKIHEKIFIGDWETKRREDNTRWYDETIKRAQVSNLVETGKLNHRGGGGMREGKGGSSPGVTWDRWWGD